VIIIEKIWDGLFACCSIARHSQTGGRLRCPARSLAAKGVAGLATERRKMPLGVLAISDLDEA